MFGSSPLVVDVYRTQRANNWGNEHAELPEDDGGHVAAILIGRKKVHTIYEAIIGPTSSDVVKGVDDEFSRGQSKQIMYTPVDEDLRDNDYVVWRSPDTDRLYIYRVTGKADLDYHSPYTGISLKETYLDVITEKKGPR